MIEKDPKIEKRIDELLAKMTVAEKVGQLNQIDGYDGGEEKIKERIRKGEVGSFIMGARDSWDVDCEGSHWSRKYFNEMQRVAVEESRLGIPIIFGHDVIHGHHTAFPDPLAMAAAFNPDMVKKAYRCIAEEATVDNQHWTFTPMLDMSHDPRWGRCTEGPGEDPYVGASVARAVVEGLQGDDLSAPDSMAACAKHFVGYGGAEAGVDYHKAEISDQTLRNYYLPAFRAAVDAGCQTVMNAFNDISGHPMASNKYLLTDVLRGEMGFDGFVVSDDHAVKQLERHGVAEDRKDCAHQALNAGIDMDMRDEVYIENVEKCVEEGTVSMEVLDEAVRRILRVKFRLGLFDRPYTEYRPVDYAAHDEVSRSLADECVTLLKNNGVLPLSKDTPITVFGNLVNEKSLNLGCWSTNASLDRIDDFETALRKDYPEVNAAFMTSAYLDPLVEFSRHTKCAVFVLGQHPIMDGENSNVTSLELSADQKEMIKSVARYRVPMIAIIRAGRPLALESIEPYFDAIIYGWHNGTQGSHSLTAALFGDLNPSGRLPITIPRVTGQEPIYYNQTSSCRDNEGYYPGNRLGNYRDSLDTPMYPFGYGLSYTTFEYSDVKVERAEISYDEIMNGGAFEISVKVKNTGDREGREVAQCYIHDCVAKLTRPIRELKGFDKQTYAPGEEKTVTFRLTEKELGYWDDQRKYVVEPGKFKVWVGPDCYAKNELEIRIK